jgi:hypothetical protein
VNQKADADGPWGDEADAQAAADTQIITVVIWDTSNIQNGPEVYEPAGMEEEDMTDDLQVILVKHDQMFYRVVLANDDGTDDDDDGLDLRVRTNLDALLDENAPTTPSSRARDAINAVSAVVSGAVSSAYASFATSSSTTANSNSREGEGRRRQNADSTPVSNNANDGTTNNGTTPRRPKRKKSENQPHNVSNF